MKPILKWAGGKTRLLKQIRSLLPKPETVEVYHEPFFGGGAVFFDSDYGPSVLSDANEKLIRFYSIVKDDPKNVILVNSYLEREYKSLRRAESKKEFFNHIRCRFNKWDCPFEFFLFLNKTCFNGLYRVNKKGEFNVPHGRYKNPTILDRDAIKEASGKFAGAELHWQGFSESLDMVRDGDFVYCDPPYVPESATADFTSYTKDGFGYQDQVDLRDKLNGLNVQGIRWAVSNSDTPQVRELYAGYNFHELQVRRSISRKASTRKVVTELFITNY